MANAIINSRFRITPGWLGMLIIVLTCISMTGCVVAIPAAIYLLRAEKTVTITMEVDKEAEEVWRFGVSHARKTPGKLEIIEEDETQFKFQAKRTIPETGEEIWTAWKVTPVDGNTSHAILTGTVGERSGDEVEELFVGALREFCETKGLKCKFVD